MLPTLYDPLSNAELEALACGLPVITSTRCGTGERAPRAERALAAVALLTPSALTEQMLDLYQRASGGRLPA